MSLPNAITPAVLDTVLGHLAPHFLAAAGNDLATARHAASRMLAAYGAETVEELRLAAEVIGCAFHALGALCQAAAPGLPPNRILRLRDSAVSLSRTSREAQRKLDQIQGARLSRPPGREREAGRMAAVPARLHAYALQAAERRNEVRHRGAAAPRSRGLERASLADTV